MYKTSIESQRKRLLLKKQKLMIEITSKFDAE